MPDGALTVQFVQTSGWVLFSAATLLSIVLGGILAFHLTRFAMNMAISATAITAYAAGCLLLISIMFAAIVAL